MVEDTVPVLFVVMKNIVSPLLCIDSSVLYVSIRCVVGPLNQDGAHSIIAYDSLFLLSLVTTSPFVFYYVYVDLRGFTGA